MKEAGEVFFVLPPNFKFHGPQDVKCLKCGNPLNDAWLCADCGVDQHGRKWPPEPMFHCELKGIE
jgi:hypothetical protein